MALIEFSIISDPIDELSDSYVESQRIDSIAGFANSGGGGYPPGEAQQNLQNRLNRGFFQIFFLLILFRMV